jgi:glycosyltransferase involved in cell wall biosynthesis
VEGGSAGMSRRYLIWYWSATGGGGSQFAVNLSRRLAKRFGPAAVRLSLHADDPLLARASAESEFETVAARVTTSRGRPLSSLMALAETKRVLDEHARNCDVVIVPMNFAIAAPLASNLRQPIVYFAHDPTPHPGDYAALGQRVTQAFLISRASKVAALSRYAAGELKRLGVAERKLVTTPLSAVFEPRVASTHSGGPMRLLFAGRMMAYKGGDILADALPELVARDNWRLTIAGAGPALDASLRERLSGPNISVLSTWMSETELESHIAACDVLLAPYRSATQSGVVAQALAFGRPSIVTPVGALPEQIGDGAAGWVSSAADARALAEILVRVLKDDTSRAAKAAAAAEIATRAWNDDHWAWLNAI